MRIGLKEEKVTQNGADPSREMRITRLNRNRKNLMEQFFHPVTEYLFTWDQSYCMMFLLSLKNLELV
jgi:hypothetical protein